MTNFKFQGPQWSKISNLSQIFNPTHICIFCHSSFCIMPNFKFHRSAVVKNIKFESDFQNDSYFYTLQDFKFRRSAVVKKIIWIRFSKRLKFLHFEGPLRFSTQLKFLHFAKLVKNIEFKSDFQYHSNFCILPNFKFPRSAMVNNIKFESDFQHDSYC